MDHSKKQAYMPSLTATLIPRNACPNTEPRARALGPAHPSFLPGNHRTLKQALSRPFPFSLLLGEMALEDPVVA